MIVKKCDRCGKEMSKESDDNEITFTKKRNTRFGYDQTLNLCEPCLRDFTEFMKNHRT